MCQSIAAARAKKPIPPHGRIAKSLGPDQRLRLGVQALAGHQPISHLADDADVSRKFVYQQADIAQSALDEAFAPTTHDDQVLFHLPVTKAWLRQVTLGLTLIGHSSYRGVVEFFRDLLDVPISLGTVHNIHREAIAHARPHNHTRDLAHVHIAALDEIYQNRRPVLVGVDAASTYCFLLSDEDHRDADTWGVRLLELQDRGFAPAATIADFALGLRAGQKQALPDTPCRGDLFHLLHELTPLVRFLEKRAYDAIAHHAQLQHQLAKEQRRRRRVRARARGAKAAALLRQIAAAAPAQAQAIALADDVAVLARWLQFDLLAVSGLAYADRVALYDFVVAQLQSRAPFCPHRLDPLCTLLNNQRDNLLAFAQQLEIDVTAVAEQWHLSVDHVRAVLDLHTSDPHHAQHWQRDAHLRRQLGDDRFRAVRQAVRDLANTVVRASSVIENLNSRLRNYFFLRRHLDANYLPLLQFFLNHRRFLRSEHPERVDQSPTELLTGQTHPHWLELLGYRRFTR
jgi:hypothetical protein